MSRRAGRRGMRARAALALSVVVCATVLVQVLPASARSCLTGTTAEQDADRAELRAALADVDATCPCESYAPGARRAYDLCTRTAIGARVRAATLGRSCAIAVRRIARAAVCGSTAAAPLPCLRLRGERLSCRIEPRSRCVVGPAPVEVAACSTFSRCLEAADTDGDLRIAFPGDSGRCAPHCGDGNVDPGEECDDGGRVPLDGCSAQCTTEVDCNPDGTYPLATPISYECTTTGPGEPPFAAGVSRIVLSDHGRSIDVLAAPGGLPPGAPLSCAGSPVDRSDATLTPQECFFVARVVASFSDPQTLTGTITLSHEGLSGPCSPNPLFSCPPVTYPFSATRE